MKIKKKNLRHFKWLEHRIKLHYFVHHSSLNRLTLSHNLTRYQNRTINDMHSAHFTHFTHTLHFEKGRHMENERKK